MILAHVEPLIEVIVRQQFCILIKKSPNHLYSKTESLRNNRPSRNGSQNKQAAFKMKAKSVPIPAHG